MGRKGDTVEINWDALVPRIVHPSKVTIIEAMRYIGLPLSAKDIANMHREPDAADLSKISYHMTSLGAKGALVEADRRQVRGAMQRFYFFPCDIVGG